jgi:hypothetical protein
MATLEGEPLVWDIDGRPIVNAIREFRPGDWDASTGEVVDGILVMRPARRVRRCCGEGLYLVTEATRGQFVWGLWRCRRCERSYSIGPRLPATWVGRLAQVCIELCCDYQKAVADAYDNSDSVGCERE